MPPHQLDAAASLMLESSLPRAPLHSIMKTGLPVVSENCRSSVFSAAVSTGSFSSMEFSRLMRNADDSLSQSFTQENCPVLPVVQEEAHESSYCSRRDRPTSAFLSNVESTSSCLISPSWLEGNIEALQNVGNYQPPQLFDENLSTKAHVPERRDLDHSVLRRSGVDVTVLDPASFRVSIDLFPGCTINDVADAVANPVNLALWCDSIRSLLITNRSEGCTDAATCDKTGLAGRQYDGEWIEATTTELVTPGASNCFYSVKKSMWNFAGFPSNYGSISMFVERQKGRVGLSVGPFDGDVTVSHSITFSTINITNTVSLSRVESSSKVCCGLFEGLQMLFSPTLQGYTDQVVSSMLRLRLLIETAKRQSSGTSDLLGPI